MENYNTFEGGMNGDLSKSLPHENTYLEALNFRPATELGESNGGLVNIKGNECKITYPQTQDIYKLRVINYPSGTGGNDVINITINGQSTGNITITNATTGSQLYLIIKSLSNCYNPNIPNPLATFAVAFNDDYVIISQQPVFKDCGPTGNVTPPVITITGTISNPNYTLMFINAGNAPVLTQPAGHFVLGHGNLYTIGSTFIRDEIYLLTADMYSANGLPPYIEPANDSFTGVGNIWKLQIDDITKQHTLTLLYTNYVDFTINHPVAPSAITGRYESDLVKRIYWCDFYNKLRTINVADPQLMALDPKLLSISPSTEFSQPVLNNIISGTLSTGCYQLAYRLTQTLGTVSNYSDLSNMVYLGGGSISGSFEQYQGDGPGVPTPDGIQWKIDNLDTSFANIESIVIYRAYNQSVPVVTLIDTRPISTTGSVIIDYTTTINPNNVDITFDDFSALTTSFTHAKTVDTKDNRLFWGNVKISKTFIDNYDSRAFRAHTISADDVKLINNGIFGTYQITNPSGSNYAANLLETEDTINQYYDSTGTPSVNACYYKPGTNRLGGLGKNISYEFGTMSILADEDPYMSIAGGGWDISTIPPYRYARIDNTNVNSNGNIVLNPTIIDGYDYPMRSSNGSNKYPYREGLLKSYQHEEIYRFAFQGHDLQGGPLFAKWIGDIKFPSYNDRNDNPDARASVVGINDFRLSYIGNDNKQYIQVMYIKFNIDVSSIIKVISGYEVVRVERNGNNKTIWGTGILNPLLAQGTDPQGNNPGSNDLYLPASYSTQSVNCYSTSSIILTGSPVPVSVYHPYPSQEVVETLNVSEYANTKGFKQFECFDHQSGFSIPNFAAGDKLLIRAKLITTNYRTANGGFRKFFNPKDNQGGGANTYPEINQSLEHSPGFSSSGCTKQYLDHGPYDWNLMPFYLLKLNVDILDTFNYGNATNNYTSNNPGSGIVSNNLSIINGAYVPSNGTVVFGGTTINNRGDDMYLSGCTVTKQGPPCYGGVTTTLQVTPFSLQTEYGCIVPDSTADLEIYKMLALYFKYNENQYGGQSYINRTNNEYISCSEFVSTLKNKSNINNTITNFTVFGGDIYTSIYNNTKNYKNFFNAPVYSYFDISSSGTTAPVSTGATPGLSLMPKDRARFSTTFFFPCTTSANAEMRHGAHTNKDLTTDGGTGPDDNLYASYHSCENNVKKYYPKPFNFINVDQWINRIYWSELKVNNETKDNWAVYLVDNFYDVEGNYGAINCLISLNNQMHYIQERGIGLLLINPIAMIDAGIGTNVKLGSGKTIEKHQYRMLDVGTLHQWSVYKSQHQIVFADVRHKKLYAYNGEAVNPISDVLGQRGFTIKRMHDNLLVNDNPIIGKGILTTYDYYHNEFLITFLNENSDINGSFGSGDTIGDILINPNREFYTLAFNEPMSKFTSYYLFKPNIYINNNKYLLSNITNINGLKTSLKDSLYFHNYGAYGVFYDNTTPVQSTIKVLTNENSGKTKTYDNLTWLTESIKDNVEWSDDYNIYPGSIANPSYPDNVNNQLDTFNSVRCYNDWENSDFISIITAKPNNNITRKERDFNFQVPRNKFDYNTNLPSTYSLFDPSKLTRTTFGERMRDKYMIVDLVYSNLINNRFIVNLLKTIYRISDR